MNEIVETLRLPAPGPEPLGLAFGGPTTLWVSSREAHRLYAIDPAAWAVREESQTPGAPFGIAVRDGELRVVVGFGDDDDDRYIYRFRPGKGFDGDGVPCPDLSGVHLAFQGETLFLSQAHNMRILALDDRGNVVRTMALHRRPLGMTIVNGALHLVTGDDDFKNLELARVDDVGDAPLLTPLAEIPFRARGLAFDGERFWTGHRDRNEIVAFSA